MRSLIDWINRLLTSTFDFVLAPLRGVEPIWPLLLISLASGLMMLWVFGKASNQQAIRRLRKRMTGNLIGVWLFQNEVRAVVRLQVRVLADTLSYLKHSLLPIAILVLPMILILAQLNLRFSARPLQPGQAALVKVRLSASPEQPQYPSLEASPGIEVETPAVYAPSLGEFAWRIRAKQEGRHQLQVSLAGEAVGKEVLVGQSGWGTISSQRSLRLGDSLLYPGEPLIAADAGVESIQVAYSGLKLSIFGVEIHWLVLFLAFSLLSAFAFRPWLGVTF